MANINADGSLQLGFEGFIAAHGFSLDNESNADKFADSIRGVAAGVATFDIIGFVGAVIILPSLPNDL